MKIAIILSGHLRSYRDTFSSFQKLKDLLQSFGQVDVFCHTWDIEDSISASWWKEHSAGIVPETNVNEKEVSDLYQPTAIRIEPSKFFKEASLAIHSAIPVSALLSMIYSQHAAYLLMDNYARERNISYDLVVKTRYDLEYEIAEAFGEKLKNINNFRLLVPNSNSFELTGACADIFAAGNHNSMSEYLKFYERFDEALSFYRDLYKVFIPELFLRTYLDKFNIKNNESEGIRFTILRTNGNRFTINSDIHFDLNLPTCFFKVTIETCEHVLHEKPGVLAEETKHIVCKYLHWIDAEASNEDLALYNDFYNGKWIGLDKIKRLVHKCTLGKVLDKRVIRSFYERALHSSQYSWRRKILLATVLWQTGNYGVYYFKALGKKLKLTGKSKT